MGMNSVSYLKPIWWLWLPLLVLGIQIVTEILLSAEVLSRLHSENGPHEIVQFCIILSAFLLSASLLRHISLKVTPILFSWIALATVSCFYVAFEEISWGQHFFDWDTPRDWVLINDQGETNLHNASSWLDQKPRLILEIGVVVGGLLIPFLLRVKPSFLPKRFTIMYPPAILGVVAGLFLCLKLIDKVEVLGVNVFERVSEVQELYMFYFVFLYVVILRQRVLAGYRFISGGCDDSITEVNRFPAPARHK